MTGEEQISEVTQEVKTEKSQDVEAGSSGTMREFMAEEGTGGRDLHRDDVIEGMVMRVDADGILVDIGLKSEGFIPSAEMRTLSPEELSQMKVGDTVLVYVLGKESQEVQVLLSLDRAKGLQGWHILQHRLETGETFEAPVVGHNKGGLLVNVEGITGFVPLSQIAGVRPQEGLEQRVGKELRLKVVETDRKRGRLILSERLAMRDWRREQKEKLLSELHPGEVRRGKVTGIADFGAFVDLGGGDGLIHVSELSWERGKTPQELLKVGDEVDVYVTKIDPETKRISLSLRRAHMEPWEDIVGKYRVGQMVTGTVTKLTAFGAFARVDGPVEGLIHISELSDRRINHPKEVVNEGDVLTLKILKIESERHRLALSLKQAEEEGDRKD